MKMKCSQFGLFCFLLSISTNLLAQPVAVPVVTLRATDPLASWSGDTGSFTVSRDGPTNMDLNIFYVIGGSASNGVDYASIGNYVLIPAGIRTNSIIIKPINNGQSNVATVELRLSQPPTLPPANYNIGFPSNGVVYISSTDRTNNLPPLVRIVLPTNGSTFYTPTNLLICADARDPDGYVARVEFFAGTNSLGVKTNCLPCASPQNPFCLEWHDVQPGEYLLSAIATDNNGATGRADAVKIRVLPGPPPPETNLPPVVRITSPPNNATFRTPLKLPIYAFAHDFDGSIGAVEFFAGSNDLGPGMSVPCRTNATSVECPTNLFFIIWSNPPPGAYSITATATDNSGLSSTSEPVRIFILPPEPPPTNRPPVVTIIATDPIAIEGTNCWVWLGCTNAIPTWSNWPPVTCRPFTNCAPKNASFLVRRLGDTNEALTVDYSIGGTATNGIDYVTLPGSVIIAAGERAAEITVVPLDDGPPDLSSTVILELRSATNYVIGFPARAAALIVDKPFPSTAILRDRCFHLTASGPDGAWFHVEYTSDLWHWLPICTNQVINGSIDFVDPAAQSEAARYYRAVPDSAPGQ